MELIEHGKSLSTIFIKRAYWAMNRIHNKIFFNQSSSTYVIPDREDKIVAMLTEQSPAEVALLRKTRELIERAESNNQKRSLTLQKQTKI